MSIAGGEIDTIRSNHSTASLRQMWSFNTQRLIRFNVLRKLIKGKESVHPLGSPRRLG